MRRSLLLFLAMFAFSLTNPPAAFSADALTDKVDKVFAQWDTTQTPGCALSVFKGGRIVYERGYGMSNLEYDLAIAPDSIFHVASISKEFTAFSIVLLAQQGKISLDDNIRKYVPEVPDFGTPITIKHLIYHTSGLRDQWSLLDLAGWGEDDVKSEKDILDLVARQKALNFKPGDEHLYCNTGYTLLAVIVKRVSGQTLREFAEQNIFGPLGMRHTQFHDDHTTIVRNRTSAYEPRKGGGLKISIPVFDNAGATSLFTTVEDLAKWDENFYDGKVGGMAAIQQMLVPGKLNYGEVLHYAFGLSLEEHKGLKVVGHGGADAGYRADIVRFPEQHFGVACLCNLSSIQPSSLTRKVADLYLADQLKEEPAKAGGTKAAEGTPVTLRADQLMSLAGMYRNPRTEDHYTFIVKEGKLVFTSGDFQVEMVPITEDRFKLGQFPVEVTFKPDSAGGPRQMLWSPQGGKTEVCEAVKVVTPTAAQLADYAGNYFSDELDAKYTLTVSNASLVLRRRRAEDVVLRPALADSFLSDDLGVLKFSRDAQGHVAGFALFAGRVRNLAFRKE